NRTAPPKNRLGTLIYDNVSVHAAILVEKADAVSPFTFRDSYNVPLALIGTRPEVAVISNSKSLEYDFLVVTCTFYRVEPETFFFHRRSGCFASAGTLNNKVSLG